MEVEVEVEVEVDDVPVPAVLVVEDEVGPAAMRFPHPAASRQQLTAIAAPHQVRRVEIAALWDVRSPMSWKLAAPRLRHWAPVPQPVRAPGARDSGCRRDPGTCRGPQSGLAARPSMVRRVSGAFWHSMTDDGQHQERAHHRDDLRRAPRFPAGSPRFRATLGGGVRQPFPRVAAPGLRAVRNDVPRLRRSRPRGGGCVRSRLGAARPCGGVSGPHGHGDHPVFGGDLRGTSQSRCQRCICAPKGVPLATCAGLRRRPARRCHDRLSGVAWSFRALGASRGDTAGTSCLRSQGVRAGGHSHARARVCNPRHGIGRGSRSARSPHWLSEVTSPSPASGEVRSPAPR